MTPTTSGRPLRVVHVITSLPTGGAERQLELLVARSVEQTATIALYDGGPVADSMRAAGRRVEVLGGMEGWRKLLTPFRLARRIRSYRPDIVHVHLLAGQLWGIPAARIAGVPVIVSTEHSLMDDTIEGRRHTLWLRLLYRVLERMTTRTVAVSGTTAERLLRWGVPGQRISLADNGIDFDALAFSEVGRARVRAELGLGSGTIVVGAVGRLDPVKRIDVILRGLAPLLRDGVVLVVAGTGPLGPSLESLAESLGVAHAVHWLGARGDVPAVLSAMDALVSTSADETFGMAVVEAVGSGLPVAFVECPALEELTRLPDGAHRLPVPSDRENDERELREAVVRIVRDLHRHAVPAELVTRYGAEAATRRVERVYDELVPGHRA